MRLHLSCCLLAVATVALTGCGPAEPEVRIPPYVVQQGCEFTLVPSEGMSNTTRIDKGNTMVTITLSMGGYRVGLSDCQVVDNPYALPLYQARARR